jgi:hypothetical protein
LLKTPAYAQNAKFNQGGHVKTILPFHPNVVAVAAHRVVRCTVAQSICS